jgi:uncharacterized protein involved in tolerance to divalent cations
MLEKEEKNIVCVYTTCSSKEEVQTLSISAIKEKLAISADYWMVNSMYPWNGVIKNTNQYILMFSTQKVLSEKLIKHIEVIHPYLVPVITRQDTSMTNSQYNFWTDSFLSSKDECLTEKEFKTKKEEKENACAKLK